MPDTIPTVRITWDDEVLFDRFKKREQRVVYAARAALFAGAYAVQNAEFANVRSKFVVRGTASSPNQRYLFGSPGSPGGAAARFTHRPEIAEGQLYAEVAAEASSQASQRRTLLNLFEDGGTRSPFTSGARASAVPILGRPARPSINRPVPPKYTFAGLAFKGYRRGRLLKHSRKRGLVPDTVFGEFGKLQRSQLTLGGVQWKGKERTFILPHTTRAPDGAVFQRFGKEAGDIREIYGFKKPFALDNRLEWLATAQRVAPAALHDEMERQFILTVEHELGSVS